MNDEIKINKANKSLTFINNGIAFSQFGIADEILDLIINLQQENQEMKTNTIPTLKHNIDALVDEVDELEDYKSRCEKAAEYIIEHRPYEDREYLLNLLGNGSDSL